MRLPLSIAFQTAALLGAAAVCALVSNGLARPERRLAWAWAPPPVAVNPPSAPPQPLPAPSATEPPARRTPPSTAGQGPEAKPREASQPVPAALFPPRPGQPIRDTGPGEAAAAFQAGIPFLDARRSAEYEMGHIQGAWSLPVWESTLEERLVEFEARVNRPPAAALVLYCSGGSCEDSHLLASRLFRMGYRNLLIYREGYPEWTTQGRPISQGQTR